MQARAKQKQLRAGHESLPKHWRARCPESRAIMWEFHAVNVEPTQPPGGHLLDACGQPGADLVPIETSKCLNSSSAQGCAKASHCVRHGPRNSKSPQRCHLTLLALRAGIAPAAGGLLPTYRVWVNARRRCGRLRRGAATPSRPIFYFLSLLSCYLVILLSCYLVILLSCSHIAGCYARVELCFRPRRS